jgi:hypothetical protein
MVFVYGLLFTTTVTLNARYYLATHTQFYSGLALLCLSFAAVYRTFQGVKRPLNVKLGLIHYALMLVTIAAIICWDLAPGRQISTPNMSEEMEHHGKWNAILSFIVLFGMLAQLLLVANVILAFRNRNRVS